MSRRHITTYRGPGTLIVQGERVAVTATLDLWQHMVRVRSFEGSEDLPGLKEWSGRVSAPRPLFGLVGEAVIELPTGRRGDCIVTNSSGTIQGSGPAPFDAN